jgi:hypothetical protein
VRVSDLQFLVSIVVSIPACHAGDPGLIPGRGAFSYIPQSPPSETEVALHHTSPAIPGIGVGVTEHQLVILQIQAAS